MDINLIIFKYKFKKLSDVNKNVPLVNVPGRHHVPLVHGIAHRVSCGITAPGGRLFLVHRGGLTKCHQKGG